MLSSLRLSFLSLLFVVVWSSGWIAAKDLLNYAGPLGALAWRYLIVVVVLLVVVSVLRLWRNVERSELWHQATIGILSHTGFLSLSFAAMEFGVSAGMVAFISALQPVFTVALACPLLRERINVKQLAGILLGILSVCMVVGEKVTLGGSVLIYCLPVLSVLSLTLATILCRYSDRRAIGLREPTPLLLVLLIQSTAAFLGFSVLAWCFGSFTISVVPGMYLPMAYLSLVVSIGSYFLYFYLLREMSAVKMSSLIYLTPPVTMILGWLLYQERLSVADVGGLFVALSAVILVTGSLPGTQKTKQSRLVLSLSATRGSGLARARHALHSTNRVNLLTEATLLSKVDIEL